jgi:hypothetical protein
MVGRERRQAMNEIKPSPHQHGDPNGGPISPNSRPYWTRAHRDWRVWLGVILMLVAMIIYVTTNDLAWGPRMQPRQPISSPSGN